MNDTLLPFMCTFMCGEQNEITQAHTHTQFHSSLHPRNSPRRTRRLWNARATSFFESERSVKGSLAFSLNFLCDWTLFVFVFVFVCGVCEGAVDDFQKKQRRSDKRIYKSDEIMPLNRSRTKNPFFGAPNPGTHAHIRTYVDKPLLPRPPCAPPSYLSGPMKRRGTPIFCISGNTLANAMPPLVTTEVSSLL